nr:predicted protein [Ipomoea batatas]GMD72018.1 predicted protein [Ipomoea batatas]
MSWYFERRRSEERLERRMAAPPIRKMQLDTSIDRLLPKYQFRVMFSMLTTRAYDTATHAPKVVALDVSPKLVMVNNHSRERRGWVKETAIHHKNPNILSFDTSFSQKVINGAKHHHLSFFPSLSHARIGRLSQKGFWEISLLPQP